jgi:hypothetical protein
LNRLAEQPGASVRSTKRWHPDRGHFLDPVEVTHDVGPLWIEASGREALIELFAQRECEE